MLLQLLKPIAALLLIGVSQIAMADDRQHMSIEEARSMTGNVSMRRVSVHDPSVVWEPQSKRYYIFGTHRGAAYTTNLTQWRSFTAPWSVPGVSDNAASSDAFSTNHTTTVSKGGQQLPFGNFDVRAWSAAGSTDPASYDIDGNLWAPDVIWNKAMQKWCMYMSVNGDNWMSSIVLLTADNIQGPYTYQGPVVFSGFRNNSIAFQNTDLQIVLGTLTSIPARYIQGSNGKSWGTYWPNAIDPCVFYDEDGQLWMTYGSWSGGIWMLRLNEANGLRDYDITYDSDYDQRKANMTTDAYFGKRIAGGYYVSGEASYIEHIGEWYYLFVTFGELQANGGYQMRVFRSKNADGPYLDPSGQTATYTSYKKNYGPNGDSRGEKLLGAYGEWGGIATGDNGETAQGHNSIIAADDGRTYLVYHTRFHNRGEEHQVRVHQVFQNEDGWLVAAPFEYTGETTTDDDIAQQPAFANDDIAGEYQMLMHKYNLNNTNMEQVTPVSLTLNEDGTVSGAYSGTWQTTDGTSYIRISIDGIIYKGVVVEQQVDPSKARAICFTACSPTGMNIWGYKMEDSYRMALTLVNMNRPVYKNKSVRSNINLYGMNVEPGVEMTWTSSHPDIISDEGHYNPTGLTERVSVTLSLRLQSKHYYFEESTTVWAEPEDMPDGDVTTGRLAYYDFNTPPYPNAMDISQTALLLAEGDNVAPTTESDHERMGNYVHQRFGINGNASYVEVVNPLYGSNTNEFSIAFWCKRSDNNLWDALLGMLNTSTSARFFMTGNCFIGYNSMTGNWIDINNPNNVTTDFLPMGEWHFVTLTVSASNGVCLYVDGSQKAQKSVTGSMNGSDISNAADFNTSLIATHAANCQTICLGNGSFWGSADACFDDLFVFDRALSATDAAALNTLENRVYDFWPRAALPTALSDIPAKDIKEDALYDLSGRRITRHNQLSKGIYVKRGKTIIIK